MHKPLFVLLSCSLILLLMCVVQFLGLTLLTEEMVNHVSYTNGVWRWKSRSGALRVNDDIRLQIINCKHTCYQLTVIDY